jgi:actin-related protein
MSSIEEKLKKMEVRFDQEEFVVIDNGTGFVKAGFSGQDLPRIIMPTVVGEHTEKIDQSQLNANDTQTDKKTYAFGNAAYQNKDTHELFEPITRGKLDWDNMEKIWGHIFAELNLEPKNVNLLMTDSPFWDGEDRKKMAEIMFDHFRVKSLQVCSTA